MCSDVDKLGVKGVSTPSEFPKMLSLHGVSKGQSPFPDVILRIICDYLCDKEDPYSKFDICRVAGITGVDVLTEVKSKSESGTKSGPKNNKLNFSNDEVSQLSKILLIDSDCLVIEPPASLMFISNPNMKFPNIKELVINCENFDSCFFESFPNLESVTTNTALLKNLLKRKITQKIKKIIISQTIGGFFELLTRYYIPESVTDLSIVLDVKRMSEICEDFIPSHIKNLTITISDSPQATVYVMDFPKTVESLSIKRPSLGSRSIRFVIKNSHLKKLHIGNLYTCDVRITGTHPEIAMMENVVNGKFEKISDTFLAETKAKVIYMDAYPADNMFISDSVEELYIARAGDYAILDSLKCCVFGSDKSKKFKSKFID